MRSPIRATCHPLVLVAAVLIVVNDHGLRAWSPGWLSGKLSDAAFLVVGPVWVAAVLTTTGLGGRAARAVALACTAAFYATLQLWPPLGAFFSASHVADAEDLVVLPALLGPVWVWTRPVRKRLPPVVVMPLLAGALIATTLDARLASQPASWPCDATPEWPAARPLQLQLASAPPDTDDFTRGLRLTDEEGALVPLVVARLDDLGRVALCAREGLPSGTAYTWEIGPWEEGSNNQVGFWHEDLPTVYFVASGADAEPIDDAEDCAAAAGLTTELREACDPSADAGGDSG